MDERQKALSEISDALLQKYDLPADFSDERPEPLWTPGRALVDSGTVNQAVPEADERRAQGSTGPPPPRRGFDVLVRELPPLKVTQNGKLRVPSKPTVLDVGPDAVAHYVTFHQTMYEWGIRVSAGALLVYAHDRLLHLSAPIEKKVRVALRLVLAHELCHYRVDRAASVLEGLYGNAVKWPYDTKNRDPILGYKREEECFANLEALQEVRRLPRPLRIPGLLEAVRSDMRGQGRGYSDAVSSHDGYWPDSFLHMWEHATDAGPDFELVDLVLPFGTGAAHWSEVPITLQHDEGKFGLPRLDLELEYFPFVRDVTETAKFTNSLSKLGRRVQKEWANTKRKLAATTRAGGLDFKKWEPGGPSVFSVRIDDDIRAHLQWNERGWLALEIGHHDRMGH